MDTELLTGFSEDSLECLEGIEQELLALEEGRNSDETINKIFRVMHSIKGSSGFFGLQAIEKISHHGEELLSKMRDKAVPLDTTNIDVLLNTVDQVKLMFGDSNWGEGFDNGALLDALDQCIHQQYGETNDAIVNTHFDKEINSSARLAQESHHNLIIENLPEQIKIPDTKQQPIAVETNKTLSAPKNIKNEPSTIRISVNVLDQLLELIGEVVLGRNQLVSQLEGDRTFNGLSTSITKLHRHVIQTRMQSIGSVLEKFKRIVRDLSKQLGKEIKLHIEGGDIELDRTILEAFSDPLTHLVRNACDHGIELPSERSKNGKNPCGNLYLRTYHQSGQIIIEVEDDGKGIDPVKIKESAIKKQVLSEKEANSLTDKELVELVFHPGFSTKEETTSISGRGVGMDVVKTNFEKLGCVFDVSSKSGAGTLFQARMPLTQAIVDSSVISGLIISLGKHKLAIPQLAVNEMIRLVPQERSKSINNIKGRDILTLRDTLIPIIRLEDTLNTPRIYIDPITGEVCPERRQSLTDRRKNTLITAFETGQRIIADRRIKSEIFIILQYKQDHFCIPVHKVVGTEEIVVKKVPKLIKYRKVFDGTTILGNGEIVTILNINGIVEEAALDFQQARSHKNLQQIANQVEPDETQKLVVFENAENEFFAIPVQLISQVQKVMVSDLKQAGSREFIEMHGESQEVIRPENKVNLSPIKDESSKRIVIIPNIEDPIGMLGRKVIDTIEIDEEKISGRAQEEGVVGRLFYKDKLISILDIFSMLGILQKDVSSIEVDPTIEKSRILLVEDMLFFRHLIQSYFESFGFRNITVARNGKEALDILNQMSGGFDLIVSDVEMPEMNGYEFVSMVKSDPNYKNLPVLALTGLAGQENIKKGLEAGFDAYEVKIDKFNVIQQVIKLLTAQILG